MRLIDCVELEMNNDDCVVLKVKPEYKMNLIYLGCFIGNEVMFRLSKGRDVTCTIWRDNGKCVSWHWGYSGYTLVCDELEKAGRLIQNCIERDLGIKCKY